MTTIQSGYNPAPCPDLSFPWIAYGNGSVSVINWQTGEQRLNLCDGYPAGWIQFPSGWRLAVSRNVSDTARTLVYLNIDTRKETPSGIPEDQQPGYFPTIAVVDDTVVSSLPGQHFIDGKAIRTEPDVTRIEDFDGYRYCFKLAADSWSLIVRDVVPMADDRIDLPLSNTRLDRVGGGTWVSANLNGRMFVMDPFDARSDGPEGESRGLICQADNGVVFAATVTHEGYTPIWLFRPLSDWKKETPAIILRGVGFDGMKVLNTPAGWLCMGYVQGAGGVLSFETVPYDAPRTVYAPPVDAPAPPPVVVVPPPPVVPTPPVEPPPVVVPPFPDPPITTWPPPVEPPVVTPSPTKRKWWQILMDLLRPRQ